MATHKLTCKYCGAAITIRCTPEDLRFYMRACRACIDNDEPGMARFDRMAAMMGARWAMDHYAPIPA